LAQRALKDQRTPWTQSGPVIPSLQKDQLVLQNPTLRECLEYLVIRLVLARLWNHSAPGAPKTLTHL